MRRWRSSPISQASALPSPAGVELGELVAVDVELELKAVGG
jgi:hypothetical protein